MNHPQSLDPQAQLYLATWMNQHKVSSLLEIGTGYAQSALTWAKQVNGLSIVTVEKDAYRVKQAQIAILQEKLENQIQVVHADANKYQPTQSFDVIFLDGPKAQLLKHFNHYISYLNPQGSIWIDNIDFHGLRTYPIQGRPNLSALMRKLMHFMSVMEAHPDYHTQYVSVGDGLMRVWRKYPDIKL